MPLGDVCAREPADIQRAIGRLVLLFLKSRRDDIEQNEVLLNQAVVAGQPAAITD